MPNFKLGTTVDEKLAKSINHVMDLYTLRWELDIKDSKTNLNVYAEVDEETLPLLEAIKQ